MALAVLVTLLALWSALATPASTAEARPQVLLLLGAASAYAVGRLASSWPGAVPVLALLVCGGTTAALLAAPVTSAPLSPPLDYGNANGALATLGVGALLVAALTLRQVPARLAGVVLAGALVPVVLLTASRAASAVAVLLVLLGAGLALRPTLGRRVPLLAALAVLATLAATTAWGLQGSAPGPVLQALSERRVVLWSESLDLLREDPLRGVGTDRFASSSPTALSDADAAWAHSVWLQQGAETGLVGLALLLALAAVLLLRGRTGGRDRAVGAMGAAVSAGLLLQASIDYVLHFPAVVAVAALLAGATARWRPRPPARGSRG